MKRVILFFGILFTFSLSEFPDEIGCQIPSYNKHEESAYYECFKMEKSEETFEILSSLYTKDKDNIYYEGRIIEMGDPETFEVLGAYSRDKSHVYFKGKLVKGADPITFEILSYLLGKDKNGIYLSGEKQDKSIKKMMDDAWL